MQKAIGNPNDWYVEVIPKRAGDFGMVSISMEYTTKEAEELYNKMKENIYRHVDDVDSCHLVYSSYICQNCKECFDTKQEAEDCKCN